MKYFSGDGLKKKKTLWVKKKKDQAYRQTAEPPSNTEKELKVEKRVNTEQVKGTKVEKTK